MPPKSARRAALDDRVVGFSIGDGESEKGFRARSVGLCPTLDAMQIGLMRIDD